MITRTAHKYLHLLKTKKGIDKALHEKGLALSKDCREIVNSPDRPPHMKKMASLILEFINGK